MRLKKHSIRFYKVARSGQYTFNHSHVCRPFMLCKAGHSQDTWGGGGGGGTESLQELEVAEG